MSGGFRSLREQESWRVAAIPTAKTTDRSPSITVMTESLLTAEQVASAGGVPRSWVYQHSPAGRTSTWRLPDTGAPGTEAIEAWPKD